MRLLLTCGGTAGHVNPAVGVAGRIKELLPDSEVLFIGADGMMETELVPREGYEIKTVTITNLHRSLKPAEIVHNLKTFRNVLMSVPQAKRIIREFKPDVAVGTGGYVCYPVLKAAHSLGIPTLVHESNAQPGLTPKMLAKAVDCVMLGFAGAAEGYGKGVNAVYTGTPVRPYFRTADRAEARKALGLNSDRPLVVSVWGSLGSDYMNKAMRSFIAEAAEKNEFDLIHSAGKRGYAGIKSALDAAGLNSELLASRGIDVREYIYDMPTVMAAADLVLCRSGASTLSELTALGKPAVLVPSPNVTANHQEKNARVLERAGGADVLLEGEFTPAELYDRVSALLHDSEKLAAMSAGMRSVSVADATEIIADMILGYVK
ncbi:MAG: UDP-N-acetylglucosamine--N-acetylmuramyl-(pentapeptide) pyrophosphoryl-undecaprenol N-acetylglucosamine transferase [Oscillospiraceae bacterium]|nr:UDP-N-acetylglucosamine--N-acetylmuramyl-(pentapeptide) pyrophosphoryl-undecaprenol N-acetylglucosamine transferase [Oscillospiraceae bacterium]